MLVFNFNQGVSKFRRRATPAGGQVLDYIHRHMKALALISTSAQHHLLLVRRPSTTLLSSSTRLALSVGGFSSGWIILLCRARCGGILFLPLKRTGLVRPQFSAKAERCTCTTECG